jgi:dsRNA-specific ribonuclease
MIPLFSYLDDVSALEERLKELGVELGNKITMLQSFENAVVGRYVQPMNLNLHHHGLAFLELKIVEHLVLNFPNIPRRKMIVLLNETLSIDVLGLCAMELNLVKFTKLIPDVCQSTSFAVF